MNQDLLFNRPKWWKASWSDVWSINPHLHSDIKPTHSIYSWSVVFASWDIRVHWGEVTPRQMIQHAPIQKKQFSLFDSSPTVRLTTFVFHQAKYGEAIFLRKGQILNSMNTLTCYQWVSIDCLRSVQVALEVTRKRLNEIAFTNVPAFWIRNKFSFFEDE